MEEIQEKLKELKVRFDKISAQLDRDKLRAEIKELEGKMSQPGFWDDHELATRASQEMANKQKTLDQLAKLEQLITDASEESEIREIDHLLKDLELQTFLSGPHDSSEAILSIHSGTGGVEAMDWTAMLARMYQRYFEKKGWKAEITDESFGEEAGYKEISLIIHAPFSYGYLKGEAGTHRLVRQSPFNADKLRQTSFALVEVLPVIENETEIDIKPDEVEFEAFRSSGAGGQNVNKVSTAVRLKHLPTGITVTAQTERSQLQNRDNAMAILRSKLWTLQQARGKQEQETLKGEVRQASWGTQIRSYVLHPYHMVKDLRTLVETSDTAAVLNGDLDLFIEAELQLDKTDPISLE